MGPVTTKGEQTRQAVLDAAIGRFGRDGFRGTSVADISRDAEVSGTVAYQYFDNKEALFHAALDADATAILDRVLPIVFGDRGTEDWRRGLFVTLMAAVEEHPLAKRVLAGQEPEVTQRFGTPIVDELRAAVTERLQSEQVAGTVRADIDPADVATGLVAIVLSLLMSTIQLGPEMTASNIGGIMAVFEAVLDPPA